MSPPSLLSSPSLAAPLRLDEPIALDTSRSIEREDHGIIRTVDELVRRRAKAHPDRVAVSYPSAGIQYVDYTMRQLDVFAYRAAKIYEQAIPMRRSSAETPVTVAILGPSNFDYLITMLALTKLGHTTLFLSTRISQEAVENLLSLTGAIFLIADLRYTETAKAAAKAMPHLGILNILDKSAFDFPVEVHADTRMDHQLDLSLETNHRVYIIHSSGSTGLPKPIYQPQKAAVVNYSNSMGMRAFITLPLYHNHGICNFFRAVYSGKPIHFYNADLPLTHNYLTEIMTAHQFEIFYGVPYALKLLSESDEGLSVLRDLKIVMYGGSAMPDELGDLLISNGINLIGHYGATEVGQLMTSFRAPGDDAWNYVRETDKLSPFLKWVPRGPGLFECCVLDGWPAKVDSNQEDGSYMTKDLFEAHPTIPKAWKYIARRDDTISLETGEMFNPVSTEGAIRSNRNVAEAVIFGAGRAAPGVLIVPATHLAGTTDDKILEVVWPIVEVACRDVEAYARISKSMIKILPSGCDYPRTDKGSVIRQAFYRTYAEEIDSVYFDAEATTHGLTKLTEPELREFVRKSLTNAFVQDIHFDDDTDLFMLGLDSLQATQVRSEILKNVDVGGHQLSRTVVFDYPCVNSLTMHLAALAGGWESETIDSVEDEMRALIEKYTTRSPSTSIVLTGATGSLGSHILAKLVSREDVDTVYCLVRARSDKDAADRVELSLKQRRMFDSMTVSGHAKIICLAADLSREDLNLSSDVYRSVIARLVSVIHCAWSVNFNMRLSSFEKSNIAGVANLIALCEATKSSGRPANFNFCSSVSAVARATIDPVPECLPELAWAQGMGYAQSKSVAEHLCARAGKTGITARVLRVGQIVADTKHGVWNNTEAITMMLQSACTIGALPRLPEQPSWLPVDTTAESIVQISLSDAGSVFAHVANPKTFDWTLDLLPALERAGLKFEVVEPREWVQRLRVSNQDPVQNPPIKLVDFFASKYDKDELSQSKRYTTDVACSLAPALADAPVLDQQFINLFISNFMGNSWA